MFMIKTWHADAQRRMGAGRMVPKKSSSVIRNEAGVELSGRALAWHAQGHGLQTQHWEKRMFPFPFICFLSAKNSEPLPHAPTTRHTRPSNQGQNLLKPGAKINLSWGNGA